MRKIEYALRMIERALSEVERDPMTPGTISPEIAPFLEKLALQFPDDDSEFSDFVVSRTISRIDKSLAAELVRQLCLELSPEARREAVLSLLEKFSQLDEQKCAEVQRQHFEEAAQTRGRLDEVAAAIRKQLQGWTIMVTPTHLEAALRSLGYGGPFL